MLDALHVTLDTYGMALTFYSSAPFLLFVLLAQFLPLRLAEFIIAKPFVC